MATSVKLTQVQSVIGPTDPDHPGEYMLQSTFSDPLPAGGNWDAKFILIKIAEEEADDTYSHICTVGDVEAFLTVRADAVTAHHEYYRVDTWDLYFTSIESMSTEAEVQQNRTQYLVDDWQTYTGGTWPKTYEHTYSS